MPNWWVPSLSGTPAAGTTGCDGSGTPPAEFGSEAARGVWRVALDALWSSPDGGGAAAAGFRKGGSRWSSDASGRYVRRVTRQLIASLNASAPSGFNELSIDPECDHVNSIHADWYWNAFMYSPMSAALMIPLPVQYANYEPHRKRALLLLAGRVASEPIESYYSGAWLAIATSTLNGDLGAACSSIFREGCPRKYRRAI